MSGSRAGALAGDERHVAGAVNAIRRILHALRTSTHRAETRIGVTAAQLFVLQTLADAPVSSLNELAPRTFTHQSSVSVVVDRLARRRLVLKRRATEDGLRALPRRETDKLARLLRRLVLAMGAAPESAAMFFEDGDRLA